ncbi:MAG: tautomerase family protein, partial [Chloroflexi bacterium]|nr:tautomerase family protein [Chloroflexota bacterium]
MARGSLNYRRRSVYTMPMIHIYLYEGRTDDQKRELAQAFTDDI